MKTCCECNKCFKLSLFDKECEDLCINCVKEINRQSMDEIENEYKTELLGNQLIIDMYKRSLEKETNMDKIFKLNLKTKIKKLEEYNEHVKNVLKDERKRLGVS